MKIQLIILTLAALIFGAGCGNKSAQQTASDIKARVTGETNELRDQNALAGNWTSACKNASIKSQATLVIKKTREELFFSSKQNDFQKKTQYYSDDNCTQAVFVLQEKGRFTIQGGSTVKEGLPINFELTNSSLQAVTDTAKSYLETTHLCGINTWPVGQDIDISSQSNSGLCKAIVSASVPRTIYEFIKADDKNLFLGSGLSNDKADQRAQNVDVSQPFAKEE